LPTGSSSGSPVLPICVTQGPCVAEGQRVWWDKSAAVAMTRIMIGERFARGQVRT
jgi:hypothetical protein